MTRAELDRLLELAESAHETELRLGRARRLELEIEGDEAIVRRVPEAVEGVRRSGSAIETITRELEREWVEQGPIQSGWQRAVEFAQQAEAAGADAAPFRDDAAEARRRLESARLATRDQRELLAAKRVELMQALSELPVDVDPPEPVREDGRPEAVRRDALAYRELAERAAGEAEQARSEAGERLTRAREELAEVGSSSELERRLAELRGMLPDSIELPEGAPPSAAQRLRRAGVDVRDPAEG